MTDSVRPASRQPTQVALVDLLDRLLSSGVVLAGEVTLSIADIDLVTISLRALLASTSTVLFQPDQGTSPDDEDPGKDEARELLQLPGSEER